jgi:hypothetical protein
MSYYDRAGSISKLRLPRSQTPASYGLGRVRGLGRGGRLHGLGDGTTYIPAGSQLTYSVQYANSFDPLNSSFWSMSIASQIATITQALQNQWNIVVINYQDNTPVTSSSASVTLNIQTMTDYSSVADIKSVIDGAFYNAAGISITSSTLAVNTLASPGSAGSQTNIGTGVPPVPPAAFDLGTWLGNNWLYLAGALVGVVVLEELL